MLLCLHTTPHIEKNLSINAEDAGMLSKMLASLARLGNLFLFSSQNPLVETSLALVNF